MDKNVTWPIIDTPLKLENMNLTTLVVGASGATGKQLVEQLLNRGEHVRVIVRSPEKLPDSWKSNDSLSIICASVLDINHNDMTKYVNGCRAVASCLGHTLSFNGVYGHPRRLVRDATRRLCEVIIANKPVQPVKYLLMNTTGNRNRDLNEPISFAQRCVISLLRLLLPPHVDNEKAADYLRINIGKIHGSIEWVAIRPDGLIDEENVTEYLVHPSPIRSAIFDAGKTSRINVGHFIADLITNDNIWNQWKGQMPVIYNKGESQ